MERRVIYVQILLIIGHMSEIEKMFFFWSFIEHYGADWSVVEHFGADWSVIECYGAKY